MPVILLMVIAILSGSLDLTILLAHLFPSRTRTLLSITIKSRNLLTYVEGVSYLLVLVLYRSRFNYGNTSG